MVCIYFSNPYFGILHTSQTLMLIYCGCGYSVADINA